MSNIEAFKKSELNGLSFFNLECPEAFSCPTCGHDLEFYDSEATGYDVELHGLYMGLSCSKCGYCIEVTGDIDYVQRKDENDNWLNPDDDGYDDLYDVWEWNDQELYYDDDLKAVCYEITDSEQRSIRYICENPEVTETIPKMADTNDLLNTFKNDLKGQFSMLPKAVLNWYISVYEYLLDQFDDYMDRLDSDEDLGEEFLYFDMSGSIHINWEDLSYESGNYPDYYSLQEIVDDDIEDEDFPPLTEEEKQLFHKMEHDVIEWLNKHFDELSLYE